MVEEKLKQTEEEQTEEEQKEETKESVSEDKPKKEDSPKFHKTRKGGIILSVIVSIMALAVIFMYQGPATPIVFGFEPLKAIGLLSIVLSLFVTLIYKFMTDQVLMKELKKDLKKHQKHMKEHRKDATKMSELSKKSMETNMKYMRQTMKPMLITMLPFLLIFQWLRGTFDSTIIFPLGLPFWPGDLGWIGSYIIFSMIFTTAFRKILDVV
jgi:uncharacterized membrane protein (DUF106 family)